MAKILQASQPWTLLHRLGETVREGQGALRTMFAKRAETPGWRNSPLGDEQAASRMMDEGCPNP